jgi:PhnB protein
MFVQPYLNFEGRCEEALEFYRKALGAEILMMMRYKESPDPNSKSMVPPGSENKVLHASFRVGESTLMASDGRCQGRPTFDGIMLTISVKDAAQADRLFAALSDGGQVHMPQAKTFFSPRFGMLADRFGINWMVLVTA